MDFEAFGEVSTPNITLLGNKGVHFFPFSRSEDVLERVTSAFNELQFQVEQAEDSEFVSAITPVRFHFQLSSVTVTLFTAVPFGYTQSLCLLSQRFTSSAFRNPNAVGSCVVEISDTPCSFLYCRE